MNGLTPENDSSTPLAERLRPRTLTEVIGQTHLLAPGKPLATAFQSGRLHSMIPVSYTHLDVYKRQVDLNQHLVYHKMTRGKNGREELYRLVSDLHQPRLDRSRPLWELHVIDGLSASRFALYLKMHHACADGVTMVRWTTESLSHAADDLELRPIWSIRRGARERTAKRLQEKMATSLLGSLAGAGQLAPVSYTHLDVYKRPGHTRARCLLRLNPKARRKG